MQDRNNIPKMSTLAMLLHFGNRNLQTHANLKLVDRGYLCRHVESVMFFPSLGLTSPCSACRVPAGGVRRGGRLWEWVAEACDVTAPDEPWSVRVRHVVFSVGLLPIGQSHGLICSPSLLFFVVCGAQANVLGGGARENYEYSVKNDSKFRLGESPPSVRLKRDRTPWKT